MSQEMTLDRNLSLELAHAELATCRRALAAAERVAIRESAKADILRNAVLAALAAQMHPGSTVSVRLRAALKLAEEI